MANVIVVDDSPLDLKLAGRMLEGIGLQVRAVSNGTEALRLVRELRPDMVLTDMQMPEMDGLQLVEALHQEFPGLPVVLMTAFGSEEIAVQALQRGAASYVPKHTLARNLVETVRNVLSVSRSRRAAQAMLDSMNRLEAEYVLSNSMEGVDGLIGHVKEQLKQIRLFGEGDVLRVGTALYEAIINAIEHGNLELASSEREDLREYRRRVEERAQRSPYRSRHVYLKVVLTRANATFVVRDEGQGFDPACLPDPTSPENVGKMNGRGLFLIRTFMDSVTFNEKGTEITMIKERTVR